MRRDRATPLLALGLLCLQAGVAMAAPGIVSPTDGSVLDGSTQTFTWSADGESVDRWRIEVGTVPDGIDLALQSYSASTTSAQISGLPTDGSSVYVNLKWRSGGAVSVASYVYIAATDGPPPNAAPTVDAGNDQVIALPVDTITLNGSVSDDGLPADTLVLSWSMSSGPDAVSFLDPTAASTSATFTTPGDYVLQLTASDTELETSDQLAVTVFAAAELSEIRVAPDPSVLLAGASQQFDATGFDQTGQPYPITPAWAATGGSIDSSGLYVAGGVSGRYEATATDGSIVGRSDIILVDELGPWPTSGWEVAVPSDLDMEQTLLEQARDYALTAGGSGMITRHGRVVLSWGNPTEAFSVNSTSKSVGSLLLGLAVTDGLVSLSDLAQTHYPAVGANPASNASTGWLDDITILNLATHTAGFDKAAGFVDLLYQPGTTWAYSDAGMNWLADTLTVVNQGDLLPILESRILVPLGIPASEFSWPVSTHRDPFVEGFTRREINGSMSISVDAMARLGYLALRDGIWEGSSIVTPSYIDQIRVTVPGIPGLPVNNDLDSKYSNASDHYGIGWWNNADGSLASVPGDAFWAWGLGDSLILVIPSLDIVASRTGGAWAGSRTPSYYQVLAPFFDPIVQSVTTFGNEAPSVDAGLDTTIALPSDTVALDASVSDDGLPFGTLETTWTMFSGPASVTFEDATAPTTNVTFTSDGSYVLRLTADDGIAVVSDDVSITVLPEPDVEAPVASIDSPTDGAIVNGAVTISATATDNNSVSEVEFFVAGRSIAIDTTMPFATVWDSTADVDGVYGLSVVARDATGNEGSDAVSVTLDNASAVNQPPVVDAGVDDTVTLPADTVTLDGSATDDGLPGGTLGIAWLQLSGPSTVQFADATALSTAATFGAAGTYELQLTADDGEFQASDSVFIVVNDAPPVSEQVFVATEDSVINGGNGSRNFGNSANINVHNFGPKVGLVQFDLSSLLGSSIDSATLRFRLNRLNNSGDIELQLPQEAWSEDTVTYDNQPAFGATVQAISVTTADIGTVVSVDVTSIVQGWADGSTPSHGFRMQSLQSINAAIDSTESAGTPMDLVVLTGSSLVTVPDVTGLSQTSAEASIAAAGLSLGTVTTQSDAAVPSGDVISQAPTGGTQVAPGTPVDLVVSTGPGDAPPVVDLVSPASGSTVSGRIAVAATATDDVGVSAVVVSVDGVNVASFDAPPYEFDWDSNAHASGSHSLDVTATDTAGNQSAASATVYVDSLATQPSGYPASPVISGIEWAPSDTIVRAATDSDNWPLTWADDGDLYTAYGDGTGFDPPALQKLSLGFARVSGPATAFTGVNIPSASGEQFGDGPLGKKASGLLAVDGILYAWVRNANNFGEQCELAWSDDSGTTWTWNDWQFAELGYCAFLNFGQGYAGTRDDYVYMYSPDTPSAYLETDDIVLTRVPRDRITDRASYEFFAGLDASDNPVWTPDLVSRQPVFTFAGAANRLDVSYHPVIGRYLMTLRSRAQNGGRNQFSLYEAGNPWGPWSVVYYTEQWEGAPVSDVYGDWGEAQHVPTKWISADGREFFLVFSGEDAFAVRHARLTIEPDTVAPEASIVTPVEGESVSGNIVVSAVATDNYALDSVAFDVDGVFIGEIFEWPYELNWDSNSVADGSHVLTAIARDTSGNQATSSVAVTVFTDAEPPTVTIVTPAEGATVVGDQVVSITAGDDVALDSVQVFQGSTLLGTLTTTPFELTWDTTGSANGPTTVSATATDRSGNTASDTVNVTVENIPNEPPQVAAGIDQSITLPTDTVLLDGTVTDDGLPSASLTVSWSLLSGPAPVAFDDAAAADTAATFTVGGSYILQLSADDGELSASDTLTVDVMPEADSEPPVVSILAPTDGSTVAGDVIVSASAVDDVAIASVSFESNGVPLGTLTRAPYEVVWATASFANGPSILTVTAADTSGNVAAASVSVTVDNVNSAPQVDAGPDQSITMPTNSVLLDGTVSDDGLPGGGVSVSWSRLSGPDAVVFTDASAVDTTATFSAAGTYVLRLTADDGALTASADTTVTVAAAPGEAETIPVAADNIINGAQSNRNFGNNADIIVHNFGPKVGLARFDLASLAGAEISDASLRFRLNKLKAGGNINVQLIEETWSEDTVTYDSQPAFGPTVLTIPVTTADVGGILSVDVTGIVQDWVDGSQPNHGIRMDTTQGINAGIDSKESSGTPMELLVSLASELPAADAPGITPAGGASAGPVEVTMSSATPGASIHYSLDGTPPTTGSSLYTAPFLLTASATVKARAYAPGYSASAISTEIYTIDAQSGGGLNNYWTLDEALAGSYANESGGGAAACSNCPTASAGIVGGAQSFDGAGNVLTVVDDGSFDWSLDGEFSIEFWIRKSDACVTREVVLGRADTATAMQWSIGCENGSAYFELADANGTGATLFGSNLIDDGAWHHVTAVHDAFFDEVRLYVDGVLEAWAQVSYTSGFAAAVDMTIGELQNGQGDTYFGGQVDELALHDRAVPESMIRRHFTDGTVGLRNGYVGCAGSIDVMPLGDSITARVGYRPALYFDLVGQGYDVNFVGSRSDSAATGNHDRDNEGWSGFLTTDIAANLAGWLSANPPHVIMLHIGTNDIDTVSVSDAVDGLASILDIVNAHDSGISVVLAQIVNRQVFSQETADFNDQMPALVSSKLAAGHKILLVDHENALVYPDDMIDLEHPNNVGYAKMAGVWFDALTTFLPACSPAAPSFVSTPVATAQVAVEFRYRPDVLANPDSRFTLLSAPPGMSVHPDTGEIRWTPGAPGPFQVDLQAENSAGSQVQGFILDVP